ncbi:fatty acid desaturase [Halobacteriovorax sp.]|uniref:fatty acid desaturase n=1 Tax=Halobacteriovorax sp. TaxID=2020862 RepID=UPI003AF1EE01
MYFAIGFLFIHWYLSLFCQSFYLHRYISHDQCKMSRGWDRFFLILTILSQGPSFLRPQHYKTLHMQHHIHSDLEGDPHSPVVSKNIVDMMLHTYRKYMSVKTQRETFPKIVAIADSIPVRSLFVVFYTLMYLLFTDSLWFLLLVPIHSLLGPIHGAIVNWCGHKYGYRNHDLDDHSKNTLIIDFLMMGELYQNNHHAKENSINFATNSFELDFTYLTLIPLRKIGVIQYE